MSRSQEFYQFQNKFEKGLIKNRPNRFLMNVEASKGLELLHCPVTGHIGAIEFKDIPCLFSRPENTNKRRTAGTVEAIHPPDFKGQWIGINQNKANRYIETALEKNLLSKMIEVDHLKREVPLGESKLDFLINDQIYLEVKTPLRYLPYGDQKRNTPLQDVSRLMKHFDTFTSHLEKGQKALFINCYLYDAPVFVPPKMPHSPVRAKAYQAFQKGLAYWQVNLQITETGVSLIKYFPLDLFNHS